jgi:hypothetical protein
MTTTTHKGRYRPTEAKYKGGAHEMYVTYDLKQRTRGGGSATYPRVKRVYIAGDVTGWKAGTVPKRSGREVHGVRIEYEQGRRRYHRRGYSAERGGTAYKVAPASVGATSQRFAQVVEVPEAARNVHFYTDAGRVPQKYRHALQEVR